MPGIFLEKCLNFCTGNLGMELSWAESIRLNASAEHEEHVRWRCPLCSAIAAGHWARKKGYQPQKPKMISHKTCLKGIQGPTILAGFCCVFVFASICFWPALNSPKGRRLRSLVESDKTAEYSYVLRRGNSRYPAYKYSKNSKNISQRMTSAIWRLPAILNVLYILNFQRKIKWRRELNTRVNMQV